MTTLRTILAVMACLNCTLTRAEGLNPDDIKEPWVASMHVQEFLRLQEEAGKICGTPVTSAFKIWRMRNSAGLGLFARMREGMEAAARYEAHVAGEDADEVLKKYDDIVEGTVQRGVAPFSRLTDDQRGSICNQWGELLRDESSPIAERIRKQLRYFSDHEQDIRRTFASGFKARA